MNSAPVTTGFIGYREHSSSPEPPFGGSIRPVSSSIDCSEFMDRIIGQTAHQPATSSDGRLARIKIRTRVSR